MFISRAFSRVSRTSGGILSSSKQLSPIVSSHVTSLCDSSSNSVTLLDRSSVLRSIASEQFRFISSVPSPPTDEDSKQTEIGQEAVADKNHVSKNGETSGNQGASVVEEKTKDVCSSEDSKPSMKKPVNRRRRTKRIAFSDSDSDSEAYLYRDDLLKLVAEKKKLLKEKHKLIEETKDKYLQSDVKVQNFMDRTKHEMDNSKKIAIQNFGKDLLDVADNLGRASSVAKASYSKIDPSKDSGGAGLLLKSLLEGVEMTEKQLIEVFRKFGMEKFDPMNEQFDPHRHLAVFQTPDASKPPGTVAAVLKPGYMLYDRIIRPAEVGVTEEALDIERDQSSQACNLVEREGNSHI